MIPKSVRQIVSSIYLFACGYCGTTETEAGAELTVDHFIPHLHGGGDEIENLVYCCHACNTFKGAAWNATSPPVLHPLRNDMALHIAEQLDGTLLPLTEAGTAHITVLHLNRPQLVRHRFDRTTLREIIEKQGRFEGRLQTVERSINVVEPPTRRIVRRRR